MRLTVAALVVAGLLGACGVRENLAGGTVVWQSTDGKDRVVQVGPCVKTQHYDDTAAAWYTTATQCAVPSPEPSR